MAKTLELLLLVLLLWLRVFTLLLLVVVLLLLVFAWFAPAAGTWGLSFLRNLVSASSKPLANTSRASCVSCNGERSEKCRSVSQSVPDQHRDHCAQSIRVAVGAITMLVHGQQSLNTIIRKVASLFHLLLLLLLLVHRPHSPRVAVVVRHVCLSVRLSVCWPFKCSHLFIGLG